MGAALSINFIRNRNTYMSNQQNWKARLAELTAADTATPLQRRVVRILWRMTVVGLVGVVLLFVGLSFSGLPTFEELENPKSRDATQIFSSDGQVLGRYYIENRVRIKYEDLSPHLVSALVATEDERFYKHSGIDIQAVARAVVKTGILRQRNAGGGSTITQQLAKLLFTKVASDNFFERVVQKLKEWIVAIKLERSYTKEEIITMYLNEFDFINGANGIQSAAETYFGTSPADLTVEQAAVLVGMLKNPALFNPKQNPNDSRARRATVFGQMKKNGILTQAEVDSLNEIPIDISNFRRLDHNEGLAPYFREVLRAQLKDILAQHKAPNGEPYDLYRDGLRIYTTIDSRMQAHAEEAVYEHMSSFQPKFFKVWQQGATDPWTYQTAADSYERRVRLEQFERLVRSSDRYLRWRELLLPQAIALELRDVDITRMLEVEEKGNDLIVKWLDEGFINRQLARTYQRIMGKDFKNEEWAALKKEWKALQAAVEKDFSTKTEMTVFSYKRPEYETDTLMSPYDSVRYHRMILQVGMLAVDPNTGHVKAWVGGVNHKYFQLDHVTTNRQVGSTFKPFVYAKALSNGYTPCDRIVDEKVVLEAGTFGLQQDWAPRNSNFSYSGKAMTLAEALKRSVNSVSAALMKGLSTPEPVRDLVAEMGIDKSKVPATPSICLGVPDLSVFEMTGAYTAFANEGVYTKPTYIERIEDKFGNVIYEAPLDQKQVLNSSTYYSMVHLLRGVAGGVSDFSGVKSDIGGKTGTTDNYSDGWFMGITPNIVTGTWVGGDDRWVRFKSIGLGQGGKMARPIFAKFLKKLEADERLNLDLAKRFPRPLNYDVELNCSLYDDISPDGSYDDEYYYSGDSIVSPDDNAQFNEF